MRVITGLGVSEGIDFRLRTGVRVRVRVTVGLR
jgi:hypothetical protein